MDIQNKISVLMPVYNGERFLETAIRSILDQTYTLFELIIVDDGSTDRTAEIIHSFQDSRIVYLKNAKNSGIVYSLNAGLAAAKYKYIARMDADDIALPQRLERQLQYMEAYPDIAVCGSNAVTIDANDHLQRIWFYASLPEEIRISPLFVCPFLHPTVMVRREVITAVNGYASGMEPAEDFELWIRILQKHKGANLPEVLLYYRIGTGSYSERKKKEALAKVGEVYQLHRSDVGVDLQHLDLHVRSEYGDWEQTTASDITRIKEWKGRLWEINQKQKRYPDALFKKQLTKYMVNNYLKIATQNGGPVRYRALCNAFVMSPRTCLELFRRKKESENIA